MNKSLGIMNKERAIYYFVINMTCVEHSVYYELKKLLSFLV